MGRLGVDCHPARWVGENDMALVSASAGEWLVDRGLPVTALFGRHALRVVLVAFGLMFQVSLGAFLLYIFALPSDRGRVN